MVMMVLLNVEEMWQTPVCTFLRVLRRELCFEPFDLAIVVILSVGQMYVSSEGVLQRAMQSLRRERRNLSRLETERALGARAMYCTKGYAGRKG